MLQKMEAQSMGIVYTHQYWASDKLHDFQLAVKKKMCRENEV
jgi:hypothetical protein